MKKAQVSMEFLMTYGWAILVVIVAISALAYTGILSPNRFMASKCSMPVGVTCIDFSIRMDGITILLHNSMGADIQPNATTQISECPGTGRIFLHDPNSGQYSISQVSANWDNGNRARIEFNCTLTKDTRFSSDFFINYINDFSGVQHLASGEIIGKVQ